MAEVAASFDPPSNGLAIARLQPVSVAFAGALSATHTVKVRYSDGSVDVALSALTFDPAYVGRSSYRSDPDTVISLQRRGGWRTQTFLVVVELPDFVQSDPFPVLF